MNQLDNSKKFRTITQIVIAVLMILDMLTITFPSSYSGSALFFMAMLVISIIGLIFITVRVYFNNVKRWEMILYYILNVIFVVMLTISIFNLSNKAEALDKANIPYEKGTNEYANALEKSEDASLRATFGIILFGVPCIIATAIFSIIGIIRTTTKNAVVKEGITIQNTQPIQSVNDNSSQVATDKIVDKSSKTSTKEHAIYCENCGNKISKDAKFCKYCGKEIK